MSTSFTKVILRNNLLYSVLLFISLGVVLGIFAYHDHLESVRLVEDRYVETQRDALAAKVAWFKAFIASEREQAEIQLKKTLRSEVVEAVDVLKAVMDEYPPGTPLSESLQTAKEALRPIRFFEGRGYFFMFNTSGIEILFSVRPELEGKNMLGMINSEGKDVVRDMIALANAQGEGFYEYYWTKPGVSGDYHRKISFIKLIPEMNLVIGAGEYLDDYTHHLQTSILKTLENVSPGTAQYFFAGTFKGVSLLGPARGRNMLHVEDVNGVKVVEELIRAARNGGGFVSYMLPAIDKDFQTYSKLSYVEAASDWGWYVGAGISLENLQQELDIQKSQMLARLIRYIGTALFIVFLLSVIFYWFTRRTVANVQTNLGAIGDSFQEAALKGSTIPYDEVFYSEFNNVKDAANQLIGSQQQTHHLESVLLEISQRAQSSNTLVSLLESIHQIMLRELAAENFFVALIDEGRDVLEFQYCVDKTISVCPVIENISDPEAKRLSLLPIKRNDRVLASKAELQEMQDDGTVDIHGQLPESWLGVPLRVRGKPIGVMVVQDYDNPSTYDDNDLHLITACSDQIALGIERKRYTELSESARDIFTSIPSGVFIYQYVSPDALYLLNANPAAEAMTNISLQDWKGREFEEIWEGSKEQGIKDRFISPMHTGQDYMSDDVYYEGNVVTGAYRVRTFFLPGEKLGVAFEDITEHKKVEMAVRESEEFHRAFFRDNHSVIHIVDPGTGAIVDTNKAAEVFYGYSREELLAMDIFKLNASSDRKVTALMEMAKGNDVTRFIAQHKLANGEVRDVEVYTGPFLVKGETQLISIIHDISDRLKNEKELAEAKEAAEIANIAKDEFLANISHEVRTPLNGVMGMLQLMDETSLNVEQGNYVDTALQSSRNLLRVLNDVLDFSKIEAGKLELREEPFMLPEILDQCVRLFKLQADEKDISIKTKFHPGTFDHFVGDGSRIRQVLFNLLGNALKFTERGEVSLEVYSLPHRTQDHEHLFFSIEDTGLGIADEKINAIFDTFTQVDGSFSRKHQGTGLGLPIVKRLVNLMGGNIVVESELGVGSTFTFCVLVRKVDLDMVPEPRKVIQEEPVPSMRVLLVEDDRVNLLMAQRLLEKQGHHVACANNGQECLDLLKAETFDVILMDIQMPVMDGIEATRIIRTDSNYEAVKSIPIIALTAHALNVDKDRALEAGMDYYLSKPFEQRDLADVMRSIIDDA